MISRAARPAARSTRRCRSPTSLPGQHRRQPGPGGAVARRRSSSATRASSAAARSCRRPIYNNWIKNEILFTEDPAVYTAAAIRRRTGRCRRRSSPARGAGPLPAVAVHLPELRQEHAARASSSASTPAQPLPRRLRRTTRSRPTPNPKDFPSERAEPAAEPTASTSAPTSTTAASSATSRSATPTTRSGRTCSTTRTTGTTEAYTLVNGGFGVRWADDKVTTSIKVVEPGQRRRPAARLRRHHQAADHRRSCGWSFARK